MKNNLKQESDMNALEQPTEFEQFIVEKMKNRTRYQNKKQGKDYNKRMKSVKQYVRVKNVRFYEDNGDD